MYKKSY